MKGLRNLCGLLIFTALSGRVGALTMNAYPINPQLGPDGYYHVVWVWRNSADSASTHDISYARSRDLKHWESCDGQVLPLPISVRMNRTIVDPVPSNGGAINSRLALGFDHKERVVVSYTKYDESDKSQVYNARLEGCTWTRFKTTQWNVKWEFGGGGTLPSDDSSISFGPVGVTDNGLTYQRLIRAQADNSGFPQSGNWLLDDNMKPLSQVSVPSGHPSRPSDSNIIESTTAGMQRMILWARSDDPNYHAFIKWESMPANRDQPRDCLCRKYFTELYFYRWNSTTQSWENRQHIASVWGGASTRFDLIYRQEKTYLAYYSSDRYITFAYLDANENWQRLKLDDPGTQFGGWDSHNYITMETGAYGFIHLAGNMHVSPLIYYSINPDKSIVERMPMIGSEEDRTTYPQFLKTEDGTLIFKYRHGSSGDGMWYFNYQKVTGFNQYEWQRYVTNAWFANTDIDPIFFPETAKYGGWRFRR